jgi:internalin A
MMASCGSESHDYIIDWKSEAFEHAVRLILEKPEDDIWFSEINTITEMHIEQGYLPALEKGIIKLRFYCFDKIALDDIIHFTALETLIFTGLEIVELNPITGLESLHSLTLLGCVVHDIGSLSGGLKMLSLDFVCVNGRKNYLTDITFLSNMPQLEHLSLYGNNISDINPLAGMVHLKHLNLQDNRIVDINPLANMKYLNTLLLDYNRITDVSPLHEMRFLTELGLSNNKIEKLSPLIDWPWVSRVRIKHQYFENVIGAKIIKLPNDSASAITVDLYENPIQETTGFEW